MFWLPKLSIKMTFCHMEKNHVISIKFSDLSHSKTIATHLCMSRTVQWDLYKYKIEKVAFLKGCAFLAFTRKTVVLKNKISFINYTENWRVMKSMFILLHTINLFFNRGKPRVCNKLSKKFHLFKEQNFFQLF